MKNSLHMLATYLQKYGSNLPPVIGLVLSCLLEHLMLTALLFTEPQILTLSPSLFHNQVTRQ